MRTSFERGGRVHVVELIELDGGLVRAVVTVRGPEGGVERHEMDLDPGTPSGRRYTLRVGNEIHELRIERGPAGGSGRVVRFAEGSLAFERVDPFAGVARRAGTGPTGPKPVLAPMPGRVVELRVSVGDDVREGQPVIVIEAMKMANELRSPVTGRVAAIKVKAGDKVEAGAPLVMVERMG